MSKIWEWDYQKTSQKKSEAEKEEDRQSILKNEDYLGSRQLISEIAEEYNSIRNKGIKTSRDFSRLLKHV